MEGISELTSAVADIVADIVEANKHRPGALLPILHAIQDQLGYVPPSAVPLVAQGLHLSRAEVHGVISFYHGFRTSPPGRHVLQVCHAEACQAMGSRALAAHARDRLGVEFGQTTADGAITLQAVYCLGNCACPPSVRIGDAVYARVDAARFDRLVAELTNGEA